MEALAEVAAHVVDPLEVRRVLDALEDHLELEDPRQLDDRRGQQRCLLAGVGDE